MRKIVFIFITMVLFASCKTTRYNVKETYTENREVKTEAETQIKESENITISEISTIDLFENTVETITTVKLSEPENGEQYPVEITTIFRETSKGVGGQTQRHTEIETEKRTNISENKEETTNIKNEFTDKTVVENKTPLWVIMGVVCFFIVLFIFVFIILKKYRIL
jgi:hypothetical protein